jgi:hypothetical protein
VLGAMALHKLNDPEGIAAFLAKLEGLLTVHGHEVPFGPDSR